MTEKMTESKSFLKSNEKAISILQNVIKVIGVRESNFELNRPVFVL